MTNTTSMQDQILDHAQEFIQTRGYNGFSFRDIASNIGIKSSSIHYYYPSKTHLAAAVASRYRASFLEATNGLLKKDAPAANILRAYAALFEATLKRENKLCLGGMLASELNSVDLEVRSEIKTFFSEQNDFLTEVILRGQSNNQLQKGILASEFAQAYLAALEGAMILARVNETPSDIKVVSQQMIALIET